MLIREARPDELPAVGELRVRAYLAGGFLAPHSGYAPRLRALGANGEGSVLVAIDAHEQDGLDPTRAVASSGPARVVSSTGPSASSGPSAGTGPPAGTGRIVGTIMLVSWPHTGQVVVSPDEAEIRALAVTPGQQGRGIGGALVRAVVERAARHGARRLLLSTEHEMRAAHRIYERAGFARLPHRDWSPEPGTRLLVYGLRLDARAPSGS